ncbi:MAG: magnesium transporter [Paracoccaceae bacterium]
MTDKILHDEDRDDHEYKLDKNEVAAICAAAVAGDAPLLKTLMEPLHAADIADLLEQVSEAERHAILHHYSTDFEGEVLSELDEGLREEVIETLHPQVLANAVRELESDDVVDLIEDLAESHQDTILNVLADVDRVAVEQALSYPEFSAGRLMQREVVMGPEHWTVGQAIDFIRSSARLPEQFYHMTLVTPRLEPVGNVTLGRLLSTPRETLLLEIVEETFKVFNVEEDEADIAYAFNQYHLISAPVVDETNRLVGVITIDDAMAVLDEEHEEDILRLAGVGESSLSDNVIETTRRRLPWLAVNLVTAIIASMVITMFSGEIERLVALAVLMPIIASMGGNAGTQTLTVAVRAMATKDLTGANVGRVIRREVAVGLVNGLVFAVVMGGIGAVWFGMPMLGVVVALAMVINLAAAAFAGILIPVGLEKAGVDPALASGPFVTTVTDVTGFFVFLGLAALLLF